MKRIKLVLTFILATLFLSSCTGSLGNIGQTMALVNTLGDLGISPEVAIGGLGGVLSLAKGNLSPEDSIL